MRESWGDGERDEVMGRKRGKDKRRNRGRRRARCVSQIIKEEGGRHIIRIKEADDSNPTDKGNTDMAVRSRRNGIFSIGRRSEILTENRNIC
jgi:hypothetical protein